MSVNADEVIHAIALTMVPQIGCIQHRILLEQLGSARAVFHTPVSRLEKIPGIGPVRARAITTARDLRRAEKELRTMERLQIRAMLYHGDEYPKRLKNCPDPPPVLFYRGTSDLNTTRMIGVVGTRQETTYGRELIDAYIDGWRDAGLIVVSGLAYGVDHLTHLTCVKKHIETVGVLAHGLDKIYPSSHWQLAREMEACGGLLTEFVTGTQPDRQNFPRRNRIVAGICEAVLVVETDIKGGSMITAELANDYNREVFAIPGKIGDEKSQGCNYLIRENRARLTMHPHDVLQCLNWDLAPVDRSPDTNLLTVTDPDQQLLLSLFPGGEPMHIDQLMGLSGLPYSRFSAALIGLELDQKLIPLPGKRYQLNRMVQGQNLLRI